MERHSVLMAGRLNSVNVAKVPQLKKKIIYLAALGLGCGMWDLLLRCAGFSLVVAHGL